MRADYYIPADHFSRPIDADLWREQNPDYEPTDRSLPLTAAEQRIAADDFEDRSARSKAVTAFVERAMKAGRA